MSMLTDLVPGSLVEGLAQVPVEVLSVQFHGAAAATVVYRDPGTGRVQDQLVYESSADRLRIVERSRQWAFDGDGALFRLVSEARRIRLAYLFDPMLAVHISNVEALPHQIAAVYEEMLPRQPLRYLLADDPGAGKTIMAGLLIRELLLRGDLQRCLVVCPANLAVQWQDEMSEKFQLAFDIVGRQDVEASPTGNPFAERDLVIGRIDLLKQDDNTERLAAVDWDLVIVDEAHRMSAHYFGNEVKWTARYRLGELLGSKTRHLLLMTATPHAGKDEDFQLFLALLDADRFEGKYREGIHQADPSDLMRRMLKEDLLDFDGKPLFPERRAYTVNYELSDAEHRLYEDVTLYVRDEMNRVERLAAEAGGDRRRTVVGFALTMLQRRLASSPAAIFESLRRRRRRLELRLEEAKRLQYVSQLEDEIAPRGADIEDLEDDLDEEPEGEASEIVDLATAAQTVAELETEVESLRRLERLAKQVRDSREDRKWDRLSEVLSYPEMFESGGARRKLVIFTEHRDTLDYLVERIGTLLGDPTRVVAIHGSLLREARRDAQEKFVRDPHVTVLVATDAAGEGVNLQRANLMVNYDLPWNPNRLEQRFGRIHRYGQQEVCHLWNLVAFQTREGAVYQRLFEKLEEEREALGGRVFDVLGRAFTEVSLRDLMLEAIRYGESDEARAFMERTLEQRWSTEFLRELVNERALNSTTLNADRLRYIKEEMDRAEARRLVPHFVESFFVEAFRTLGGTIHQREPRRYEISRVPTELRQRDRQIGRGAPVQARYERICFDKNDRYLNGKPEAAFLAPGHPLLDAVVDLLLERHRDLLRRGCVLVDDTDATLDPRVMFSIESEVTDGRLTREGNRSVVSRRVDYVEIDADGDAVQAGAAPYLDYRPPAPEEIVKVHAALAESWIGPHLEQAAQAHAVTTAVQEHFELVHSARDALAKKTIAAVRERLTKEIQYWDHRAEELKEQELAGRRPRLNSGNARRRAEELEARLERRMRELERELDMTPQPPVITGGCLVLPARLVASEPSAVVHDPSRNAEVEALAMKAVMDHERYHGRTPEDVSKENRGWDVESHEPDGHLRFIEVKGRHVDAETVTVSKNEWLTALNKREQFYLAIVYVEEGRASEPIFLQDPFQGTHDFAVTSVNFDIRKLVGAAR